MNLPKLLVILALLAPPAAAEEGWERVGDEDGIVTERRVVEGSGVLEWRGAGLVEAPLVRVWIVLHDVPGRTKWMERCVESRLLDETPARQLFYNRTSAPWPAAHRDVVLDAKVVVEPTGVKLPFRAVRDAAAPPVDGVVRMEVLDGHWLLRPVRGGAATLVEYQVHADPGGWIPAWIANRVARTLPATTLALLRQEAAKANDPAEESSFLARPGVRALLEAASKQP